MNIQALCHSQLQGGLYGKRLVRKPVIQTCRYKRKTCQVRSSQTTKQAISQIKQDTADTSKLVDKIAKEATKRMKKIVQTVQESYNSDEDLSSEYFKSEEFLQLRNSVKRAIGTMQYGLVERDTEVRLLLLAALSGEHALFIGPPGTAKSELGRRLSNLCDGTYFERLLTRFSVPEELFGPLSMRALEEDKYLRQTTGYLPQANVAFIDEIFKANSAILNTLLTLLNERLFDNGQARESVPLVCLVGASNELPESEELDALYDRFLVRKQVKQVTAGGLSDLLLDDEVISQGFSSEGESETEEEEEDDDQAPSSALLNLDSFITCRQKALKEVSVPKSVIDIVVSLRTWLQENCEPAIYVSDRRLVKAMGLLKVAAYTNGRQEVNMLDMTLLPHVLWQRPDEFQKINDKILEYIGAGDIDTGHFDYLLQGIFVRTLQLANENPNEESNSAALINEVGDLKKLIMDSMKIIWSNIQQEETKNVQHLWISSDDLKMISTLLAPKFQAAIQLHQKSLKNCLKLEAALEQNCDPVVMASVLPDLWQAYIKNTSPQKQK